MAVGLYRIKYSVPLFHSQKQGRTKMGDCRAAAPLPLPKRNFGTHFINKMILIVLRDLPFGRYQPLKSADD